MKILLMTGFLALASCASRPDVRHFEGRYRAVSDSTELLIERGIDRSGVFTMVRGNDTLRGNWRMYLFNEANPEAWPEHLNMVQLHSRPFGVYYLGFEGCDVAIYNGRLEKLYSKQ